MPLFYDKYVEETMDTMHKNYKLLPKPDDYQAPKLGYLLLRYTDENVHRMYTYCKQRVDEFDNENNISAMEYLDIFNNIIYLTETYNKYIDEGKQYITKLISYHKDKLFINDLPKKCKIQSYYICCDRHIIRMKFETMNYNNAYANGEYCYFKYLIDNKIIRYDDLVEFYPNFLEIYKIT